MTIRASKFAQRQLGTVTARAAGDVIVNDYFYDLPTAQNITGDIIDMGILPAYHTVSDVILITDDLDTGTAMTMDVGIMSGTPGDTVTARTCDAVIFAGTTAGQTGAVARPTLNSAFKILATEADRSIGLKVLLQAGTPAAGRVRLRVFMHGADHNTQF